MIFIADTLVLLYVYTSTPLQQYQYVPKETVRHQASCEEVYTYVYPVSLQQQMHDKINCKKESYRLSSTCGAPRNHTNVPPVDAHV